MKEKAIASVTATAKAPRKWMVIRGLVRGELNRCDTGILKSNRARLSKIDSAEALGHLTASRRETQGRTRLPQLRAEAWAAFDEIIATRSLTEWLKVLDEVDVPCEPIIDRPRLRFEEQIIANDMMVEVQHPVAGRTHIAGTALHLSEMPSVKLDPAPTLGQHTDEILGELGYSAERIAELRVAEVI